MIRVLLYLLLIALIAAGVVWLADRPGDIVIVWQGLRIETSVLVAATAIAALIVIAILLWSIVRTILRSPDLIGMFLSHRRGVRGYLAISRGLVAVGAGDARAAKRAADEAHRIAGGEPLALLLDAQVAQLSGDRTAAEHAFRQMAERDDTRLLGLRGLYIEAQRRSDHAAARAFAEQAANAAPALGWAGQAALEFRCAEADWTAAQAALDRNYRHGLIDKSEYRRARAVLLTARALAAEETDRDGARTLALDALKLAPTLVPAAELAGRLLSENGELRRGSRVIEKAWAANPHPDLADTYAHLRPGDSARERLSRVQALARNAPKDASGHAESALAVARAALDAQEFAAARAALKPLLKEPTRRVAALMAEIEERESGDEGRAREWMGRAMRAPADPAWTADGFVSDRWMPVSPVSGRLDAFQWKVPLAEIAAERRDIDEQVIESTDVSASPPRGGESARSAERSEAKRGSEAAISPAEIPAPEPAVPAAAPGEATRSRAALPSPPPQPAPRAEAVIPLMHVPDDPGPDPQPDLEPEPGSAGVPRGLRRF
ncbi:MAG: heme biosynthesis protein HemY [Xanthobacteraceae bacterium]|nr:heme biosynthesis protein HemY [Xanthobacteraceae bacterium]